MRLEGHGETEAPAPDARGKSTVLPQTLQRLATSEMGGGFPNPRGERFPAVVWLREKPVMKVMNRLRDSDLPPSKSGHSRGREADISASYDRGGIKVVLTQPLTRGGSQLMDVVSRNREQ